MEVENDIIISQSCCLQEPSLPGDLFRRNIIISRATYSCLVTSARDRSAITQTAQSAGEKTAKKGKKGLVDFFTSPFSPGEASERRPSESALPKGEIESFWVKIIFETFSFQMQKSISSASLDFKAKSMVWQEPASGTDRDVGSHGYIGPMVDILAVRRLAVLRHAEKLIEPIEAEEILAAATAKFGADVAKDPKVEFQPRTEDLNISMESLGFTLEPRCVWR
jgi:hypothetical protein